MQLVANDIGVECICRKQASFRAETWLFNVSDNGTHTWAYWGRQLQAMQSDLQRVKRVMGAG